MQDRCLPVLTLFLAICLCSLDPAVTWMPAQRKCTGQVCVLNACDYLQQRFTIFPPRCLLKHSVSVQNKTKHLLNSFNLVSHLRSLMAGIRRRKQTPILYVQYHALKSKLRVLINYNALPAILQSDLSQDKQNSQLIWVSRGRLEGAGPTASPGRPEDGCTHQPVCPRLTGAVGPLQLPLPQVINSPYPEPQHAGEPPQAQNPAAHGLSAEHRHTPKTCWFKSIYVVSHLNTDSKAYTALKQVVPPSTWDQHCSPRQEGQHSFFFYEESLSPPLQPQAPQDISSKARLGSGHSSLSLPLRQSRTSSAILLLHASTALQTLLGFSNSNCISVKQAGYRCLRKRHTKPSDPRTRGFYSASTPHHHLCNYHPLPNYRLRARIQEEVKTFPSLLQEPVGNLCKPHKHSEKQQHYHPANEHPSDSFQTLSSQPFRQDGPSPCTS